MIKLTELIAGKHDKAETLNLLKMMFKKYNVRPKIQFVSSFSGKDAHSMYAHYDFDRNIINISKSMNKNPKEFLISVLHELYHAMDKKKYGKKFSQAYEMEIAKWQAENPSKADEWYKHNKFEIAAEKFGRREASKWVKIMDHLKNKNNKVK